MTRKNIYGVLTYEQFQLETIEGLRTLLGKVYKVELTNVLKNNSVELVAIIIKKEGDYLSPNIYLETYYDKYLEGMSVEKIVENIIDSHFEFLNYGGKEIDYIIYEWPSVKDKVFYRVINADKNKKFLETVPHLLYLDLAVTFQYLVSNNTNGLSVMRITKQHMKEWGIRLKDIKDAAMENTPRLFPINVRNMSELIWEMLNKDWLTNESNYDGCDPSSEWPEELLIDMLMNYEEDKPMYVVSNNKGINGASCILYKEYISELAKSLDSDLYILPSSIHELIVVKDDGYTKKDDLINMVVGINEQEVEEEDFLSNKVYHYSRSTNMVRI